MTLIIMEGGRVDDHVVRSAVRLVHPMVLRNVFSMALDEMDKVYDLDSKVRVFVFNNYVYFKQFCRLGGRGQK